MVVVYMRMRSTFIRYIWFIFLLILVVFIFLNLYLPSLAPTNHQPPGSVISKPRSTRDSHLLGVIVPFRDRFDQLLEFVPHIDWFLTAQGIQHRIYVINQVDELRFNRAYLINIGYLQAKADQCDYIVMHDIDLLPLNPQLNYSYPSNGVVHLAAPELHPKYHYKTFIGGVLVVRNIDFELLNGMSNRYYGWGREDDEFFVRMRLAKVPLYRPFGLSSNQNNTFRHIHSSKRYPRDNRRFFNQTQRTSRRDRKTGLNTTKYEEVANYEMVVEGAKCTVISVMLFCDIEDTPWCTEPPNLPSQSKSPQIQTIE